jgi:hypothetical protein
MPPRGVTKVERLNRAARVEERRVEESRFVTTPSWSPPMPRLETKRKTREEAKHEPEEESATLTPTLPTGQPRMRGVNMLLSILAMIGCIHVVVMMGIELNRMVASQQEITRLSLDTGGLEREVAGLQSIVNNGNDPAYREQLARKAGFAYPDEVRYLSVPLQAETTTNQP